MEELASIFDSHETLRRTTRQEVDALVAAGMVVEILPAKAIFQRKAGSRRHKTRIVARGNFESGAGQRSTEKKTISLCRDTGWDSYASSVKGVRAKDGH